jgi:hypothetical protein
MTTAEYNSMERKLSNMDDLVNRHLEHVYYDANSKWCIGLITKTGWILCSLPGSILFKYDANDVHTFIKQTLKCLYNYSLPSAYSLDIIQIDPTKHYCIRKTYWLKLIQRKWKAKMREYHNNIRLVENSDCLRLRELFGRHILFDRIKQNKLQGLLCDV